MIDTHAHVTYLNWVAQPGSPGTAQYDEEISRASLRLLLSFGITTVRNPGGPTAVAVGLRERVRNGELAGPAIFTAGEILNRAPRFDGLTRPVATDAEMPVGNRGGQLAHVAGQLLAKAIDVHVVVAATLHFGETHYTYSHSIVAGGLLLIS